MPAFLPHRPRGQPTGATPGKKTTGAWACCVWALLLLLAAAGAAAQPATTEPADWTTRWVYLSRVSALKWPSRQSNYTLTLQGRLTPPPGVVIALVGHGWITQALSTDDSELPLDPHAATQIMQEFERSVASAQNGSFAIRIDSANRPGSTGATVTINGPGQAPAKYQRITGEVPVLISRRMQHVDIDLDRMTDGQVADVVAGITVAQVKAEQPSGGVAYKFELAKPVPTTAPATSQPASATAPVIITLTLLDQDDNVISELRTNAAEYVAANPSTQHGATCTVNFIGWKWNNVQVPVPTKLRVCWVTNMTTQNRPFELTDVTLP